MANEPSNNRTEYLEMVWTPEDASHEEISAPDYSNEEISSQINVTTGEASAAEAQGLSKLKTTTKTKTNSKSRKNSSRFNEEKETEEEPDSGSKKLDHNAKERIRRMKLNASYLALRSLLPDSRRSKVTIPNISLQYLITYCYVIT